MKPLELTWCERNKYGEYDCPEWDYGVREVDAAELAEGKRFTEAELAAEWWHAKEWCMFVAAFAGMPPLSDSRVHQQAATLHRFATHPHFSDAD